MNAIYSLPLLFVIWGVLYWLLAPVQLYYSRYQERKADAYARQMINDPQAFAFALAKLADESLAELEYSTYKLLFKASHPSIGERVKVSLNSYLN